MATLTIRSVEEGLKKKLRIRAAYNGRSMEDEVRAILKTALAETESASPGLATTIQARFRAIGGVELDIAERQPMREPPEFGE